VVALAFEVPLNRDRPRVVAACDEINAQVHDPFGDRGSHLVGDVFGRRERAWNAASPSTRYRAINFETHPFDTP
jgi:hypothetical protein